MQKEKENKTEIEATELYKNAREFQKNVYYSMENIFQSGPFLETQLLYSAGRVFRLITDFLSGAKTKESGKKMIKQEMARLKTELYSAYDKEDISREVFAGLIISFSRLKRVFEKESDKNI